MQTRIEVQRGDITKLSVDAIINAANSSLMGGGGVDGAIHRAGGPEILKACREVVDRQGGCPPGEAVITTGGKLPAKFVIHTVGPVWRDGSHNEARTLENCYKNSLAMAVANNCTSVAFPNISTGVYGFPKKIAAEISVNAVMKFLENNGTLHKVVFVCFDSENFDFVSRALKNPSHA